MISVYILYALVGALIVLQIPTSKGAGRLRADLNLVHMRHDKLMARFDREQQERAKLRKRVVKLEARLRKVQSELRAKDHPAPKA